MIKLRDFIIIICLLGISALLYFYNDKGKGSYVQIDYNGYRYEEVEFSSFGEDEVRTYYVNETKIIVDKNGAYFAQSPCKGQVCVNSGKINKSGQTVVCLPQKVSIRVEESENEFDAITG